MAGRAWDSGWDDATSHLLRQRIVFVHGSLDDDAANRLIAQLIYLEREDPEAPVRMHINNRGGVVYAALALYDVMAGLQPPVETVCVGAAQGGGALLLSGGARGRRAALPHARVMLHEPTGGIHGPAGDLEREARRLTDARDQMTRILARNTGRPFETVDWDIRRPLWLTATEAKDYGLIDVVVDRPPGRPAPR